jgi:hypothetical protein
MQIKTTDINEKFKNRKHLDNIFPEASMVEPLRIRAGGFRTIEVTNDLEDSDSPSLEEGVRYFLEEGVKYFTLYHGKNQK